MHPEPGVSVDECNPAEAWTALKQDPTAQLVDVRTRPEWSFVGIPDLSSLGRNAILAEWRSFPDMQICADFAEDLLGAFGTDVPQQLFFICRSGARSMEAAREIASTCSNRGISTRCVNVAEGFEGDLDDDRHRGQANGWKARGLSWQQS